MGKQKKIWALLLAEEDWRPCPLTCDFPLFVEDLSPSCMTWDFALSPDEDLRPCPVTFLCLLRIWCLVVWLEILICLLRIRSLLVQLGHGDLRSCPVTCVFPLSVENLSPSCMTWDVSLSADEDLRPCFVTFFCLLRIWCFCCMTWDFDLPFEDSKPSCAT